MQDPSEVTQLLRRVREGDRTAANELLPEVYQLLRVLAAGALRRQDAAVTLQPTALVNEAWLKLFGAETTPAPEFEDREHFLAFAATAMRNLLVDRARARGALKRGGARGREELDEVIVGFEQTSSGILDLHAALEQLAVFAPDGARVVEMRFFGGLTNEEIARVMNVSTRTVEREWRAARAWLYSALVDGEQPGGDVP